jgi:hypothetical protein
MLKMEKEKQDGKLINILKNNKREIRKRNKIFKKRITKWGEVKEK